MLLDTGSTPVRSTYLVVRQNINLILMEEIVMEDYTFKDGYSPDNCWFRGRYITRAMIDTVRDALSRGKELTDIDIIIILGHMNNLEDLTVKSVGDQLDYLVQTKFYNIVENRGVAPSREDEEFLMHIFGWEQFCIMQSEIARGRRPDYRWSVGKEGRSYCVLSQETDLRARGISKENMFEAAMRAMEGKQVTEAQINFVPAKRRD